MSRAQESASCQCVVAGFCDRFQRTMDVDRHESCQANRAGYRDYLDALARGVEPPAALSAGPPISHGALRSALNFAKAVFNQAPLVAEAILTGDESAAFRSREEIEAIAAICKGCSLFNGHVCTHQNCGCAIDEERSAWWSKIAWKSQRCPDDPPRWT